MTGLQTCNARRPVLVPVDFSSCSTAALVFASNLSPLLRSPLLVLHVVHESGHSPGYYRKHDRSGRMVPMEDVARELMKEYLAELREKVSEPAALDSLRTILVSGKPGERILEVAAREDAGMVIMSSHGHHGLSSMMLGSVARQVSRGSPVPVTIIREPRDGWEGHTAYSLGSSDWWETSSNVAEMVSNRAAPP